MAFTADLPTDNSLAPYFIYRDTALGQPYDPTAALVFFPAKDSDELFDALRIAFPHLKTHSERMREAVISFLIQERETEQLQMATGLSGNNIEVGADTMNTSPWEQSWPSMSSGSTSTFSSPQMPDLTTPTFGMSPQPQAPQLSRQISTTTTTTASGSLEPATPALENMTGVFSISATGQPKQRIRRKMTEAEKVEYRKRRMVKACEKCAKRKRKCNHNEPEMENLTAKQKVTKPTTSPPARKLKNAAPTQQAEQTFMDFEGFKFDDTFATDMQLFDDFTNVFEDQTLEYDLDQQKHFDHLIGTHANAGCRPSTQQIQSTTLAERQLRWDEQPEWSLVDSGRDRARNGVARWTEAFGVQNTQVINSNEAFAFDQVQVEADHMRTGYHPHELFSTINTRGQPQGVPQTGRHKPAGNGMLWEHLRTGQVDATHTRHVHDAEGQSSYVFDSAGRSGASSSSMPARKSLAQTVLQLSGTAKAIRAFGKQLKSNGPKRISLQLVSLSPVASAIAQSAPKAHGFEHTDQHLLSVGRTSSEHAGHRFLRNIDLFDRSTQRDLHAEPAAEGPLEGMKIGDYLRMKTNFDDLEAQMGRGGQALPSMTRKQTKSGYSSTAMSSSSESASEDLTSTSVSVSSGSPVANRESTAQNQGRPAYTFGDCIARAASPSTELYMLKRRIPKALHSIIHRDNHSDNGIPEPILQTTTNRDQWREAARGLNTSSTGGEVLQPDGGAYLTESYTKSILSDDLAGYRGSEGLGTTVSPWNLRTELQTIPGSPATATPSSSAGQLAISDLNPAHGHSPTAVPAEHLATTTTQVQPAPAGQSVSQETEEERRAALQNTETVAAEGRVDLYEFRLRDTHRRRDHFGRASAATTATTGEAESNRNQARESRHGDGVGSEAAHLGLTLVVMGSVLLLASMVPSAGKSHAATILALACIVPIPLGKHKRTIARLWHFFGLVWDTMAVQCTIKNSSWLRVMQSAIGHGGMHAHDEANRCNKGYSWHDAAWPGTSGEGKGRRLCGKGSGGAYFVGWGA